MSNLQIKIEVLSKKLEDINSLADKYFEENFKDKEIRFSEENKLISIYLKVGWFDEYRVIGCKNNMLILQDNDEELFASFKNIPTEYGKIKILKLLCKNSIS